jgi:hypothetical protein
MFTTTLEKKCCARYLIILYPNTVMDIDFKNLYMDTTIPTLPQDSVYYLDYISMKLEYDRETAKTYNYLKSLKLDYVSSNTLIGNKQVFNYPNEVTNKEIRTKIKKIIQDQNKRLLNLTNSIINLQKIS